MTRDRIELDPLSNPAFTGSDVHAILVFPNDEDQLYALREYFEALNQLPEEELDPEPLTITERVSQSVAFQEEGSLSRLNQLPIFNLQTVTISTFRNKSQVRALGFTNPKGYGRGSRTVAGTLILTELDRDSFWHALKLNALLEDTNLGDGGAAVLVDQLPAFNMVLLFQNEYGRASYRYIYGIEIATNGVVYSIQDMYHENTISFTCQDVTPLTPIREVEEQEDIRNYLLYGDQGRQQHPRIRNLSTVTSATELARRHRQLIASRNPFR